MSDCTALALVVAAPVSLATLGLDVTGYVKAATADGTRRAYAADWSTFVTWCDGRGVPALPCDPQVLALYLAELVARGRKAATIDRALVGIGKAHTSAGFPSPRSAEIVKRTRRGIRNTIGTAQTGKAPALLDDVRAMVATLPAALAGQRDRALLLVGFAGAFRRSELVALDTSDVAFGVDGLTVTIRKSKTDQEGAGRKIGVPFGSDPLTCPVRALRAWLDASGVTAGPIFRAVDRLGRVAVQCLSDRTVALVVKRCADLAGLDSSRFAGHSLRAGLATSAAKAGKSERAIMAQTGHRSVTMVRRYIRDASLFSDNAASGIGL